MSPNNTKYLIIADKITLPIDEGLKRFTYNLIHFCTKNTPKCKVLCSPSNIGINNAETFKPTKTFLSKSLLKKTKQYKPNRIYYIPEASTTLASFLRAYILKITTQSDVFIINSQKRKHSLFERIIIKKIHISVITFSNETKKQYQTLNLNTFFIPLGVDIDEFTPVEKEKKIALRKKYNLDISKKYALHVGHIKENRNILSLTRLVSIGFTPIIVGSTSTHSEEAIKKSLIKSGAIVINSYLEKIHEIYQLSDIYIFPVFNKDAAIEFPLSVLEAMSTNLPVVSTRFGGLIDIFKETDCFKYFLNIEEMTTVITKINYESCNNRDVVSMKYNWDTIFQKIINI